MARAATSPELALFRGEGQWATVRAAIFQPTTIYTARINQVFTSWDKVLQIAFDGGSGTLANVLPDMTLLIGSTAGAHDIGICRVRDKAVGIFYIGEESRIKFMDNHYLTVIDDFGLWARHVLITGGVPFMDGGVTYSDQHTKFDPVPIMGSNRVVKLEGATVEVDFDFSDSYCPGSSISGYVTSSPTASAGSGLTTSTPTLEFDEVGWHTVYLTLTAANGKTFFGVRYVFVWNETNLPPRARIGDPRQDAEAGGWEFEITLLDECDLDTIRDHALVILFAEEYYGTTKQSIGPLEGCENILVEGWIARESIDWNPQQGVVKFTGYGAHYWLQQIAAYPDGVQIVPDTPTAWTQIQRLTVDLGLYHFIRWRTTTTRVIDVFLTGNTLYTAEVSSLAQNLWEQILEMSFLQVFARPGVNRYNQLFIQVHPQLVPEADRDWPTVMDITEKDWVGTLSFDRTTIEEVAQVSLSGMSVNQNGKGTAFFGLSTGHTYGRWGKLEMQDRLLVEDQAQTNELCGLYYGWRNNPFKSIPITFTANNRLIDCFPRQKCTITIDESDTPRGISYELGLIPASVSFVYSPETGYIHTEVTFEGETIAALAINGDVPGNGDISTPPSDSLPPLIDFPPILLPGFPEPTPAGPKKVIGKESTKGLIYSADFYNSSPHWLSVNAGLGIPGAEYDEINEIIMTPSGGIYVAHRQREGFGTSPFIAYAPFIGATFTVIENATSIKAKEGGTLAGVIAIGVNPLNGQAAYVIGGDTASGGTVHIYVGSGTTFSQGVILTTAGVGSIGNLSFGHNNWRLTTALGSTPHFIVLNAAGSSIVRDVSMSNDTITYHVPISTTDEVFGVRADGLLRITQNGAVSGDFSTIIGSLINPVDFFDNHFDCDPTGTFLMTTWDSGQRGRSSDGGTTVTGIPNLPFGGHYAFAYAGGAGATSRWVVARGIIRYSPDRGETWQEKGGNILGIAPIPVFEIIKVVQP